MEKQQLTVNGMSCGHCVNSIETFVGKLNGVSHVKVHLGNGKVDVEYDSSVISLVVIKETIEDVGYEVE
jgi:copper chaperone